MTLKEEFEKEIADKYPENTISIIFEQSLDNYVNWLENKIIDSKRKSTGLFDKNEKLIHVGDIISYYGKILLVESDLVKGLLLKPINKPFRENFEYDSRSIIFAKEKIEVIGNIYENPELLK